MTKALFAILALMILAMTLLAQTSHNIKPKPDNPPCPTGSCHPDECFCGVVGR
jgi:hypothetical protein